MIDQAVLDKYDTYYFSIHTRAHKKPIAHPYIESINEWMVMQRPMMNALKQKWKDFIAWVIEDQGYANLRIERCEMRFDTYYSTGRRHDTDNSCPKFLIDGLVAGGFLIDDDSKHLEKLTLVCHVDKEHPRTVITVNVYEIEKEKS